MKPPPSYPAGMTLVAMSDGGTGQVGVSGEFLPYPSSMFADLSGSYAIPIDEEGKYTFEASSAVSFGHVGGTGGVWLRPFRSDGTTEWAFRLGGAGGTGETTPVMAPYDMPYLGFNAYAQRVSTGKNDSSSFGLTMGLEYLAPLDNSSRDLQGDGDTKEGSDDDLFDQLDLGPKGYPVRVLWPTLDMRWEFGRKAPVGFFMNVRMYLFSMYWSDEETVINAGPGMNTSLGSGIRF